MRSILKNLGLTLLGSLMGAATVLGYADVQAAVFPFGQPTLRTSIIESAPTTAEDLGVSIYQRLGPAVVSITNLHPAPVYSVPRTGEKDLGTGFIIDQQGHIITNNHVVDGAERLDVTLIDGAKVQARLVGRDPGDDLAVIQIDMTDAIRSKIAVAPLGDSSLVKTGQQVFAIGNPFGFQGTLTSGIVSNISRDYSTRSGRQVTHVIQTDAATNPGNSGGPLINSAGEVIGINTAIESPVQGFVGIGLAVPMSVARRFLPGMLAGNTVSHPWLGVIGMAVTDDAIQGLGLNVPTGVYVMHLQADSPASRASLKGANLPAGARPGSYDQGVPRGGDVVTAVDGHPLASYQALNDYVDSKNVGDTVTLSVLRDGNPTNVDVVLESWPDQ